MSIAPELAFVSPAPHAIVGSSVAHEQSQNEESLAKASDEGHLETVVRILGTVDARIDFQDAAGRTPLSRAVERGHLAIVKLLLGKKANPEAADADSRTPLWWAAEKKHGDIIKVLLDSLHARNISNFPVLLRNAMHDTHSTLIHVLLTDYFDSVAQGDFSWVAILREEGTGLDEIAGALQAPTAFDPWISSASVDVHAPLDKVNVELHQPQCAHHLRKKHGGASKRNIDSDLPQDHFRRAKMHSEVSAFCGLAGVFPPGGWSPNYSGLIGISGGKASAIFRGDLDPSEPLQRAPDELISQLCNAARGLNFAAVTLQKTGFCCNQFTILTVDENLPSRTKPVIQMHCIQFSLVVGLVESIEGLQEDNGYELALSQSVSTCEGVLKTLFGTAILPTLTTKQKLHLCALTVQLLCLGLVYYSHGHSGLLHPDYLAEPLHEIEIRGTSLDQPYIISDTWELACLGEAVAEKVFVFKASTQAPLARDTKVYLIATCEEIVDSWGPAALILDPSMQFEDQILGLVIRGGIIKLDSRLDSRDRLHHWQAGSSAIDPSYTNTFNYRERITVGTSAINTAGLVITEKEEGRAGHAAVGQRGTGIITISAPEESPLEQPVRQHQQKLQSSKPVATASTHLPSNIQSSAAVNDACPRSIAASWAALQSFLAELATRPSCWVFVERSFMLQFGDKAIGQVGGTQTKQDGVPLKRAFLDRWTNEGKLSQFEEPWGLQVSLCTGVARRVPLRLLILDDLMPYVDSLRVDGWVSLQAVAKDAMTSKHKFAAWSEQLTLAELKCMQNVFSRLLQCLKDTGFDSNGLEFSILCPYESDARFCLKVRPEHDHEWCEMLKDKEWCATFAVATNRCLEAPLHKCRQKKASEWEGVRLLSTHMLPSLAGINPSAVKFRPGSAWKIEHDKRYWNGKIGEKVQFVARKKNDEVTKLEYQRNRLDLVPKRFWSLLPFREVLVERSNVDFQSEEVIVVS